jgi:predicted DNA-binding protein YlxM (UPF0122 family)
MAKSALTPEQQHEIRMFSASGRYTYKELAEKYFVSKSTIGNIVKQREKIEVRKFKGYYRKPERNKQPMKKKFDRQKVVREMIEAVSEFSLMDNWTELYLMETLLSCGLTREDFEMAGYLDFYKEYFEEAV